MPTEKYYSDEEIIDLVENIGDSTHSYFWVADKVRERFAQKDERNEWQQRRLNIAAEHIGHQLITELLDEGY